MHIGLKLLRADGSSLREEGRVTYPIGKWIDVEGNGAYIAVGPGPVLTGGGDGPLLAAFEYDPASATAASVPNGCACYARVRRIARGCLSAPAKRVYDEAIAPAKRVYDEAIAPAKRVYDEAAATAWRAYDEATAPARRAYDEAIAIAWRAYDEAIAPAKRVYDEAAATAWRAYDEAVTPAKRVYDEAIAPAKRVYDEAAATAWRALIEAAASPRGDGEGIGPGERRAEIEKKSEGKA